MPVHATEPTPRTAGQTASLRALTQAVSEAPTAEVLAGESATPPVRIGGRRQQAPASEVELPPARDYAHALGQATTSAERVAAGLDRPSVAGGGVGLDRSSSGSVEGSERSEGSEQPSSPGGKSPVSKPWVDFPDEERTLQLPDLSGSLALGAVLGTVCAAAPLALMAVWAAPVGLPMLAIMAMALAAIGVAALGGTVVGAAIVHPVRRVLFAYEQKREAEQAKKDQLAYERGLQQQRARYERACQLTQERERQATLDKAAERTREAHARAGRAGEAQ